MIVSTQGRRWLQIATAIGLAAISGLLIADQVRLAHLDRASRTYAPDTEIRHVQSTMTHFREELDQLRHQPAPVAQTAFDAVRTSQDERLDAIEQIAHTAASAAALTALETRVHQIELHAMSAAHSVPTHTTARTRAPAKITPPVPPFIILGLEQRGGESFLTVAPPHFHALSDVQLLAVGDNEGEWQLEALDADTATFRTHGQTLRLPTR